MLSLPSLLQHFLPSVSDWFVNPCSALHQTLRARFMYIFAPAICIKLASDLLKQQLIICNWGCLLGGFCMWMHFLFGCELGIQCENRKINQAKRKNKTQKGSQIVRRKLLRTFINFLRDNNISLMLLKLWNILAYILKVHIILSFCCSVKSKTSLIVEALLLLLHS